MRSSVTTVAFLFAAATAFATGEAPLAPVETLRDPVGLHGPQHLARSPDDRHVYVAASEDDALTVLARDASTGSLTVVETLRNGIDGVDGLGRTSSVAVSTDGRHVYATGRSDDALAVFARDAVSGRLTPVEVVRDGAGGVTGLGDPRDVVVTADGSSLYVLGFRQQRIVMFARQPADGSLAYLGNIASGGQLTGLPSLQIFGSPDDRSVYVRGRFTLRHFVRDPATGLLTSGASSGHGEPSAAVVSPDGRHVYSALGAGAITAFDRDPATGALSNERTLADGLRGSAPDLALSPDGTSLYRVDTAISHFRRDPATGDVTFVGRIEDTSGTARLEAPTALVTSSDGTDVYVTASDGHAVAHFERDPTTGALAVAETLTRLAGAEGLAGASAAAVSPDGRHVYVAGREDAALVVFARDATSGALTWLDLTQDGDAGIDGLRGVGSVVVAPDGRHVYAVGEEEGKLAVFARDTASGLLAFVQMIPRSIAGRCGLAITAAGNVVYWGCPGGTVVVLARDAVGGTLTEIGEIEPTHVPRTVAVAPGDVHVYVGTDEPEAYVFERDTSSGLHTLQQRLAEQGVGGNAGVGTLQEAADLSMTSSGRHVVAVSASMVSSFRRDERSGRLDFVGSGGGATSEAGGDLTPDDALAVVAIDGQIDAYALDPVSGALVPADSLRDADVVPPLPLAQAADAVVSPDGRHAYVVSPADHAVTVLALGACAPMVTKPSLKLTRIGLDPTPGNDRLILKSSFVIRGGSLADLDPARDGLSLAIGAADLPPRVDVDLPAGAFGGNGTRGWLRNGARWLYKDTTGAPLGGIASVTLLDKSRTVPGLVQVVVKGKDGIYPLEAGDVPAVAQIGLGLAGCARTFFTTTDCDFRATTLSCKAGRG